MAKSERYFVGPQLLSEIRETITRVGGMPDRTSGLRVNAVSQDLQRHDSLIRIINYSGQWLKGTEKTVTIDPTTVTMTATNLFNTVWPNCSRKGAVARAGSTWYLIAAEGS